MISEIGIPCGAERGLEHLGRAFTAASSTTSSADSNANAEEWMPRRSSAPRERARAVDPVPLLLPRIRRQRNAMPIELPIKAGPIDRRALDVELGDALEDDLPVIACFTRRGQPS